MNVYYAPQKTRSDPFLLARMLVCVWMHLLSFILYVLLYGPLWSLSRKEKEKKKEESRLMHLYSLFLLRGKFAALENISCKIKSGCEGHLPWPEGICTKCQPSAITLNRQVLQSILVLKGRAEQLLELWIVFRAKETVSEYKKDATSLIYCMAIL